MKKIDEYDLQNYLCELSADGLEIDIGPTPMRSYLWSVTQIS